MTSPTNPLRTKWELFKALGAAHPLPCHFVAENESRYFGSLRSVERADASGHLFTVAVTSNSFGIPDRFNIRTVD